MGQQYRGRQGCRVSEGEPLERIGVFDSGIGGLTVLRRLRSAFPRLDMVYLGDLARVPYGGRSVDTIARYAVDDVEFLLRRGVEAVVAACGTVSSNALEVLQRRYDLPVYGVIDSAARRAAALTKTGSVGVIGTQATIKSGAFRRHVAAADPAVSVTEQACPLIVPLVENGVEPGDPLAELVCRRYLSAFEGKNVDALIMGCTHYPLFRPAFEALLPGVEMIDVGQALAEDLRGVFGGLQGAGRTEYFVTERSAAFDELVRNIDPGVDPADIRIADIDE